MYGEHRTSSMLSFQMPYRPRSTQLMHMELEDEKYGVPRIRKYQNNIIRSQIGALWIVYTIYYKEIRSDHPISPARRTMAMSNTRVSHSSAYHATIALADLLWAPHLLQSKRRKDRERGFAHESCLADSGPIRKSFDMTTGSNKSCST